MYTTTLYYIYKIRKEDFWIKKYSKEELKQGKNCKLIGTAELTEDFFIDSNEDVYSEFVSLEDVELTYKAEVLNGEVKYFVHTLSELILRAKDGILPYISFKEHKVNNSPIITVKKNKIKIPV